MRNQIHRTTWKRIGIALGVAVALGAALLATRIVRDASDAALLPRLAWPTGERQVFRLTYRSTDAARPIVEQGATATAAADLLTSQLELEATVAVSGEGSPEGDATGRLRFEVLSCERATWEIAGGTAWSDAAQCAATLVGASLGAAVTPAGVTTALYDPADADTSAQSVLQALWLRLLPKLPAEPVADGASYWAEEPELQGTAANVYRVGARDGGFRLERATQTYLDVRAAAGLRQRPAVDASGAAAFAIDERGLLRSAQGDERIAVHSADQVSLLSSETAFHFEWLRSEAARPPLDFAVLTARAPTSALVGADVRAQLLDHRIAELDLATLLATVRATTSVKGPDDARFLWRATGFLEKHPDAAWELLAVYRSPGASAEAKGRVLDLLASVGNESAQAAMRAALGDVEALAAGDVTARHLYQRLGLLARPNAETAEMVAAHYRALHGGGRLEAELTSAYSLGAIVGRLAGGDDRERALADAYNAELAADLRGATDPTEIAYRVTALGNAKRADNVAVLAALADHPSARVRSSVAQALGMVESDAPPPAALLGLMGDADLVVQRNAVRGATPSDDVYSRLAVDVSTGRIAQLNVRPILDLVKAGRRDHRETTSALLQVLLAQGIEDDKDREVALLLARAGS